MPKKPAETVEETPQIEVAPVPTPEPEPVTETENSIAVIGAPANVIAAEEIGMIVPDVAPQPRRPSLARLAVVQPMSQSLNVAAKAQGMKFGAQGRIAITLSDKDTPPIFLDDVRVHVMDRYMTRQMWPFDLITGGKLEVNANAKPICGSHNGLVPSARYVGKYHQDWRGQRNIISITDGLECKNCPLSKGGPAFEYDANGRIKRDEDNKAIKKLKPDGKPVWQAGPCREVPVYVLYLPDYNMMATISARNWTLQSTLDGLGGQIGIRYWFVDPVGRTPAGTTLYRNMRALSEDPNRFEVYPVRMSVQEINYSSGTSYAPAFALDSAPYTAFELSQLHTAMAAYRDNNVRDILTADFVFESEEDEYERMMEAQSGTVSGTATPSAAQPF